MSEVWWKSMDLNTLVLDDKIKTIGAISKKVPLTYVTGPSARIIHS